MTIDAGRLARAIWLNIQPVSGGYLVSGGAADHTVEIDGGYVHCDCIDAQVHGDGCKHSLAVRLNQGDPDIVKALRALVPAATGRSTGRRTRPDRPETRDSGRETADRPISARDVAPGAMIASDPRESQSRG